MVFFLGISFFCIDIVTITCYYIYNKREKTTGGK